MKGIQEKDKQRLKKKRTTLILISLVGAAFLLGCIGWNRYFKTIGEQADPSRIIYLTLQLYFFESGDPASFGQYLLL